MKPWIGVDLDGTLAFYDGGTYNPEKVGAPIPTMVARVKAWLNAGWEVKIFTDRVSGPDKVRAREVIHAWVVNVFGRPLDITCEKDYGMVELWDDRAVTVEENTGRPVAPCLEDWTKYD